MAERRPGDAAWARLRAVTSRSAGELWSPLPPAADCCAVCRGPARPGYAHCYQCSTHLSEAPGMLADAVVPVSYAVKGGAHAARLRQYKSQVPEAAAARAVLRALLLVFLRDHGPCIWRHAAMPPPTRLAVVPGGQGRLGAHPLLGLLVPQVALAHQALAVQPGEPLGRALNPRRFRAERCASGQSVLLVDDTWVSGASAQSAAVALRMAGARHVAVVILGRHIDIADPHSRSLASVLPATPYDAARCAVHAGAPAPAGDAT